jgi:endonuclease-3
MAVSQKTKRDIDRWAGENANSRRVRALHRRLNEEYGPFEPFPHKDGFSQLIVTVLSQNTSDVNRDRAYENLKKKFPTWDDLSKASAKRIESAIRVGGLAHNKSLAIKKIVKEIKKKYGKYTLDPVAELPMDEALDELTSLPSVGVKTAACILLFTYDRPAIPVDTHVHRLSIRLGLVKPKATAEQTFRVLMEITPDELKYPFHVFLIKHGRKVCRSRKPLCGECVLSDLCPSAFSF